jgi:hypothetical protein
VTLSSAAFPYGDRSTQVRVASGLNWLLGLLLIATPWVFGQIRVGYDTSPTVGCFVIGALLSVCGAIRFSWPHALPGLSEANVAFGFWTLVSPWTYGYAVQSPQALISVGVGIAAIGFGTWSVCATLREQYARPI